MNVRYRHFIGERDDWCIAYKTGPFSGYNQYYYTPGWDGIPVECIRVKSGSGTIDDPFIMDIIHPYRINLQTSTGGTITVSSSDPQREPATDVTSVKWESGGDYTLTAIAKPAENYSFLGWYEAIVDAEGNITGYTGDPISLEKTITLEKESSKKELYALFKPVIKEVSITIDAPIAGDTVTIDWVDPDDHSKGYNFYTQKPIPNISVTGNCSVSVINGEGIPADRKMAFWLKSKLEIFMGDFVNEEKYYVSSKLVADPGYEFSSGDLKPTVTVNGEQISDFIVTNNEEGSFLEFYALLEAYDPDDYKFVCTDDGGGVWEKGSSTSLSFTFDRKKGGAKIEDLQGILMDGKEVVKDDKNYLVKDGSVIVELQPDYLKTLSAGEHTMTAVFIDEMTATVRFTIKDKKEAPRDKEETRVKTYSIPVTGVE